MEAGSIIRENELRADRQVAAIMRISAVVLTLVLIANIVGLFIIPMVPMIIAYVIGVILLMIPTLLVNVMKVKWEGLKWIFVIITIVFVSIIIAMLNWHAPVIYIYPVGIATLYYSKKLNMFSLIVSLVAYTIAQAIAFLDGFVLDRNQDNLYDVFIYGALPRGLCLIAMAAIFISGNKRNTDIMSNLMDADAQKKMLDDITVMKQEAMKVSDKLVDSVSALSDVSHNTTQSNQEIADEAKAAREESQNSLIQIEKVTDNVSMINDNLTSLAERTETMSTLSAEVKELSYQNADSMAKTLVGFEEISDGTNKSLSAVKGLESKSNEIKQIIEVITGISDQTNLLALNASIESARAGEAGRGFAVVADEIRKLAEETGEAVGDISSIIEEVVSSMSVASNLMEQCNAQVQSGINLIKDSEETTRDVMNSSEEMNSDIKKIDSLTKDIVKYSESIVDNVRTVKEQSTLNLSSMENVSKMSDNSAEQMERLVSLVSEIEDMSSALSSAVN